jgi:hypothetical protein
MSGSHSLPPEQVEAGPRGAESPADAGEASRRAQWLRDLEQLDRIEFQNACFFDAMGSLHAAQLEGMDG